MEQTKIKCPECGEEITVNYRTTLGKARSDEGLAIWRAISKHVCKSVAGGK